MAIKAPKYILACIAVSLGGLCNGYDSGAIGSMTTMAQFAASLGKVSPTMHGFIVSLVMLAGAVPAFFAGYMADRFGRLRVILLGATLYVLGAALQAASTSVAMFLAGRALGGLGQGIFLSNVNVYLCEVAPVRHRGRLAGMPQFMTTAGICFGYFTCYGTVKISGSMAWRLPCIVQSCVGGALGLSCLVLPESPRWLMMRGQSENAIKALQRLDFDMVEAERDILPNSTEQQPSLSLWQSIVILFRRAYRSRTVMALFILGMIQLSGIDAVIYYAPILFSKAGLSSDTASFLASGASAIAMLAISIPAFLFADKWGRRTATISGGTAMCICMFLMGSLYASGVVHPWGAARLVVIVSVFIFALTYASTWAIVGKIYASEIQPAHTRAGANCVAQGLGFFTNWLVAIITPILLDKSAFGAYFLFGGLTLFTVAVLVVTMPETRGQTLENIQLAFQSPRPSSKVLDWFRSLRASAYNTRMQEQRQQQEQPSSDTDGAGTAMELETLDMRAPMIR